MCHEIHMILAKFKILSLRQITFMLDILIITLLNAIEFTPFIEASKTRSTCGSFAHQSLPASIKHENRHF